jgi:hypothetical protein
MSRQHAPILVQDRARSPLPTLATLALREAAGVSAGARIAIALERDRSSGWATPALLLIVRNGRPAGTAGDAGIRGRAGAESRMGFGHYDRSGGRPVTKCAGVAEAG